MAIQAATLITRIGVQGADSAKREINSFSDSLSNVARGAGAMGGILSAAVTAPMLAASGAILKTGIDFESAFTGVIKTVNATDAEIAALRQGIRDMSKDLPATAVEIASVAEAAGQLGIETDNILDFTRVMIDLGETTNLTSTQAATDLARLANITGMSQKDFGRLGSTIVALGNNFATTESEIVSMAMRLAAAGSQIGLTEAQILGLAAALSSVGIEAEAGGTAFSRVMIDMAQSIALGDEKLALFAQTAGMTVSEFAALFEQDAAGALVAFIEGLGNLEAAGGNVFSVLEELELGDIRVRDALLRAAGAGDLFRKSMELGTTAWEENIALTREAELRYGTTASQIAILRNRVTDLGVTLFDTFKGRIEAGIGGLESMIVTLEGLVTAFTELDPSLQNAILAFAGVLAAAGPVLLIIGGLAAALAFLTSPIGLVVLAAAALAAAWMADWGNMQSTTQTAIDAINAKMTELNLSAPKGERPIDTWMKPDEGEIKKAQAQMDAFWLGVTTAAQNVETTLAPIMAAIEGWLATKLLAALTRAQTSWGNTFTAFADAVVTAQAILQPVFDAIGGWLQSDMPTATTTAQSDWDSTWADMATTVATQHSAMQPVFDAIVVGLVTQIPAATAAFQADWNTTWTNIAAKLDEVRASIASFFTWLNGMSLPGWLQSWMNFSWNVMGGFGLGTGMGGNTGMMGPPTLEQWAGPPAQIGGVDLAPGMGSAGATLDWAQYIDPLDWAAYVESPLWVEIIEPVAWLKYIKAIQWPSFIQPVKWAEFVKALRWDSYVDDVDWARFIPRLNWGAFIGGVAGSRSSGSDNTPAPGSGVPGDPLLYTPPAASPWDAYSTPTAAAASFGGGNAMVQFTGPVTINNMGDIERVTDLIWSELKRRM